MNKTLRRSQRISHLQRILRELEWLFDDAPYTDGTSEDRENLQRHLGDKIAAFEISLRYNKAALKRETKPESEATSASDD